MICNDKISKMDNDLENQMDLHSKGAIVIHKSSFDDLTTYKNSIELGQEFIDKWVSPFYMRIGHYYDNGWIEAVELISSEITEEITLKLLGDFNWRTRLVGGYFSAVKNYQNQIDVIGTHFLKSEVCCVGHIYALILAFYNNSKTINILETYLDYYLEKPELYFDQESALEAIVFLDEINETNLFQKFEKKWIKINLIRNELQKEQAIKLSALIEKKQGKQVSEQYLNQLLSKKKIKYKIDTEFIKTQVKILVDLQKKCT